jgi:O-antigen ligase
MELLNNQREMSIWPTLLAGSLAGTILFSLISITLMESFLALAFVSWLVILFKRELEFSIPAFFWPLLAYSALSIVACIFSVNPEMSFKDARELLLYLAVPITMGVLATPLGRTWTTRALLASGLLSSLYSIGYFLFMARPGERIQGFMGHYMTQAGLLLLFLCAAMAFLLFSRERTRWVWGVAVILAAISLALTLTRSAWVGFVVALVFLLVLYRPKALVLVPVVIGLFLLVSPRPMKQRALSIFSLQSYANRQRIEYLKAGWQIVREYPLHGTGPDTVDMVFQNPKYGLSQTSRQNVHLHNNIVQIAAERGIPTVLAWLVFIGWSFLALLKRLKDHQGAVSPEAAAAAAALLALFTAGLFEYNFADSEVIVLFLYLISAPFASVKTGASRR